MEGVSASARPTRYLLESRVIMASARGASGAALESRVIMASARGASEAALESRVIMASARGVRGAARIDSARRKVPMDCRTKETFILKLDTKKGTV